MLSQRRRAPVSSKLTRCHPTADTPTIDVHVNRVNRDHPLSAIHPASSSSSLSCPLLLSSTSSSSLPVRARPSFDRVRRLQRGFRLSCYELSNGKQKFRPPSPLIPCRLLFSFLFLFSFPPSPSTPLFHQFYSPSRKNIYFRKNVCARARIFLLFHRSVFGLLFFFPAKRNQGGGRRERISQVEGKIGSLTTPRDTTISPSPAVPMQMVVITNDERAARLSF